MSNRTAAKAPASHVYFRAERGIINGLPARRNIMERCSCSAKANHSTPPVA